MKTFKKVLIGMLILVPLLSPTTTKAGGFDDWFHSFLQDHRDNSYGRPGEGRGPASGFRPYDPRFQGRQVPGRPTGGGSGAGNAVPIDGGIVFLLFAGLALGAKKMYDLRKREVVPRAN
jgi:hypothetical protein